MNTEAPPAERGAKEQGLQLNHFLQPAVSFHRVTRLLGVSSSGLPLIYWLIRFGRDKVSGNAPPPPAPISFFELHPDSWKLMTYSLYIQAQLQTAAPRTFPAATPLAPLTACLIGIPSSMCHLVSLKIQIYNYPMTACNEYSYSCCRET